MFHRSYLRDSPMNVWIMLRLLAKYGNQAKEFVMQDKKLAGLSDKEKDKRIYYRAPVLEEQDDENEHEDELNISEWRRWTMDEDGNLIRLGDSGFASEIHYVHEQQDEELQNPDEDDLAFDVRQIDPGLYDRLINDQNSAQNSNNSSNNI